MIEKILERLREKSNEWFERWNESGSEDEYADGRNDSFDEAIQIVQEVAKEYGKDTNVRSNGWISCSEQMPKENGLEHYEITFLSGINKTPIRSVAIFSKGRWYMPGTNCRDCDRFPFEVIAWKKPSAPYQKGE